MPEKQLSLPFDQAGDAVPPAAPELDRFEGALLGVACGDALGAPIEFMSQEAALARYGRVVDLNGGGLWGPGEWTDDTGMTLCTAEGILEAPDDPVPAAGRRFLEWRRTAKDVGATISAALSGFRGNWAEASRGTSQARSGKAAGNGSLMRAVPVALAYEDERRMLVESARLSAMTHWDPQAEVCCALYCLWLRELLRGSTIADGWRAAIDATRRAISWGTLSDDTPGPEPLPDHFWPRIEGVTALGYDDLQPSGYAGYALECLEAAAWCCLHAASAEEAIVDVVNLAGEADTMGAVAGGIAGAHWGGSALPVRWLEVLRERDRLSRAARGLRELCAARRAG
ncbi:MAG: ADP-ribosylglycohydrolase family protein [Acidobacteriota bacterium]